MAKLRPSGPPITFEDEDVARAFVVWASDLAEACSLTLEQVFDGLIRLRDAGYLRVDPRGSIQAVLPDGVRAAGNEVDFLRCILDVERVMDDADA